MDQVARGGAHARRGGIVYIGEQRVGWRLPERLTGRHVHCWDVLGERCVTGECHAIGRTGRRHASDDTQMIFPDATRVLIHGELQQTSELFGGSPA